MSLSISSARVRGDRHTEERSADARSNSDILPRRMDLQALTAPIVQISLDLTRLDEALDTAQIAVDAGVAWLEAGTPLLLAHGATAVEALHARFPNHPIVADAK